MRTALLCLMFAACNNSPGFAERECSRVCKNMTPAHNGVIVRDTARHRQGWDCSRLLFVSLQ